MQEIKCPNCGEIFAVDESGYAQIVQQVRDKEFEKALKHREKDFALYSMTETLAPKIIAGERAIYKGVSANVDFYSGFVYSMLDIPTELFTPIFAIARIVGWSAHRLEELINVDKIIRPAYQSLLPLEEKEYTPLPLRKA